MWVDFKILIIFKANLVMISKMKTRNSFLVKRKAVHMIFDLCLAASVTAKVESSRLVMT